MKKLIAVLLTITLAAAAVSAKPKSSKKTLESKQQELIDRMELRDLVDRYATESDKGNQEYYAEIFTKDLKLRVYSNGNVNEINGVDEMIKQYKAGGAAKISFHQTGEQVVDFTDGTHATGIVYLTALLGDDKPAHLYIRYYDKYEKIDGRWWITERDQHFVYGE